MLYLVNEYIYAGSSSYICWRPWRALHAPASSSCCRNCEQRKRGHCCRHDSERLDCLLWLGHDGHRALSHRERLQAERRAAHCDCGGHEEVSDRQLRVTGGPADVGQSLPLLKDVLQAIVELSVAQHNPLICSWFIRGFWIVDFCVEARATVCSCLFQCLFTPTALCRYMASQCYAGRRISLGNKRMLSWNCSAQGTLV